MKKQIGEFREMFALLELKSAKNIVKGSLGVSNTHKK